MASLTYICKLGSYCIRAPSKRWRYWESPMPKRFPEGEARRKSWGSREISRADGDGFPNNSRVLVEDGHSLIIKLSTGSGSDNPSLWTGKDWQCYNKSFPAADERMCRNKKLGNRKRDFSNFPNLFFLDPPPPSSAMVSICLMPLPPGHPPSDLRDPPFPLRTFKFKHKHFLSCHFNEHRCFWNLVEILEKVWNFGKILKFWKKIEILEKI